jgi:two-component system, cell cycle response regulator DivK
MLEPKRFARVRKSRHTRGPMVLIADDDRDARTIYATYLRAMGCGVRLARNGDTAVREALRWSPDVIVMDLAMPKLDGWSATRRLRSLLHTFRTPVIALSAVQTARESAHLAGCDAFIAKPCLPELLWWHVRTLCA